MGLAGWRVDGELPDAPKFVMVVAPHTSNWDFPLGVLAMLTVGVRLTWLGKHTLFRFPVAGLLRWLGGEPVNRSSPRGVVGAAIDNFRTRDAWVFAVAPEGTRKAVPAWKTGFHRVAVAAGVPILPIFIDYRTKAVRIGTLVEMTGDATTDIAGLRRLFDPGMARYPDQFIGEPEEPARIGS
jgi:1-acyl-sn-glycerol-3-phosphate acyltransferase